MTSTETFFQFRRRRTQTLRLQNSNRTWTYLFKGPNRTELFIVKDHVFRTHDFAFSPVSSENVAQKNAAKTHREKDRFLFKMLVQDTEQVNIHGLPSQPICPPASNR